MNTQKHITLYLEKVLLTTTLCLCAATGLAAKNKPPKTVAYSEVSADYQRVLLSSGKFQTETYILGEGQLLDHTQTDASLHTLDFSGVAHTIAPALAEANFLPAENKTEADLLIVISWGKTKAFDRGMIDMSISNVSEAYQNLEQLNYMNGSQGNLRSMLQSQFESSLDLYMMSQRMFDSIREENNRYNALLLGYQTDLRRSQIFGDTVISMQWQRNDLYSELESARYFVILQAYDFQKAWKEKQLKMLWSTRFSIRAKGRRFDEELWQMAMASSRVMATETKGLKRNLKLPSVEFGELEYLGIEKD